MGLAHWSRPEVLKDHQTYLQAHCTCMLINRSGYGVRLPKVAVSNLLPGLLCDSRPKIEASAGSRPPRSLQLQHGDLMRFRLTMPIAQPRNHGRDAHKVRDELNF